MYRRGRSGQRWLIASGAVLGGLLGWARVSMGETMGILAVGDGRLSLETVVFSLKHVSSIGSSTVRSAIAPETIAAAASTTLQGAPATMPLHVESHNRPAGDSTSPSPVNVSQHGERPCGDSMELVEGSYCTAVAHNCLEPYKDGTLRCKRYAKERRCFPPLIPMRFCMDRYEYPNRAGEKPTVMVNYMEAQAACEAENKRLCTAREWTLACEGPELLPYPYGHERDASACNIDQPHRFPDAEALVNLEKRDAELERLDQRVPSGERPGCVSAYGVRDLTGNVDEWVTPDGPEEPAGLNSRAALKGGHFGPVRSRCRPSTTAHGPDFKFYQVGFRCCSDLESPN